jgi:hypothetical protein
MKAQPEFVSGVLKDRQYELRLGRRGAPYAGRRWRKVDDFDGGSVRARWLRRGGGLEAKRPASRDPHRRAILAPTATPAGKEFMADERVRLTALASCAG